MRSDVPAADHVGLDSAVKDLRAGLPGWVDLPLQERIALLADVRRRVGKEAAGIVAASREAQGLPAGSHWEGDVWFGLAPWANQISALEVAMGRAAAGRDVVWHRGRSMFATTGAWSWTCFR